MAKEMQRCFPMRMDTDAQNLSNREATAAELMEQLRRLNLKNPCVLALSPAAIAPARSMAAQLGCEWNLFATKKIVPVSQPEVAVGAIAENGEPVWNERYLTALEMNKEDFSSQLPDLRRQIEEMRQTWKVSPHLPDLSGRPLIVIVEGVSSHANTILPIRLLKRLSPSQVIVVLPTATKLAIQELESLVDRVIWRPIVHSAQRRNDEPL